MAMGPWSDQESIQQTRNLCALQFVCYLAGYDEEHTEKQKQHEEAQGLFGPWVEGISKEKCRKGG